MEIRHLRYFIAVAKTLHFGAAAEALGIATPTLSVQIKQLEMELGVQLFIRQNRGVELNEAGRIFLVEAEKIITQTQNAIHIGRRAGRGELGELRIGYVSSALWSGALSSIMTDFKTSSPDVNIMIKEEKMNLLPFKVCDGVFDAAFVRGPIMISEELKSITVSKDYFCIAMPEKHPLTTSNAPINPSELKNYSLILPEQRFGSREVARRGGFTINEDVSSGSLIDILARVSFGEGISIVPESLSKTISLPQVSFRELAPPAIPSEINLIYKKWNPSPLVMRLINAVNKVVAG